MPATKSSIRALIVSALIYALATCGGESPDVTGPGGNNSNTDNTVASVTVSPGTATVEVGNTTLFQAQARNASGSLLSGVSFSWNSSNSNVASVSSSGLATAQGVGSATITATAGGVSGSAALNVTQRQPQFSGFDFQLAQGYYWDYFWTYEYNSASGPQSPPATESAGQAPAANVHSVNGGHFRITLGPAQVIDGVTAYQIVMSGEFLDPGDFDFTPRWQYVALVDNQVLGSTDGQALEIVFDAMNGTWSGGGFWAEYSTQGTVSAAASTIDNEFITTDAISVGRSAGQDFCETIAGYTICPNDQAYTFSEAEYFKAGIGPVGYHSYVGYSFSGGGFYDSFSHERTVGLVASSVPGAAGIVPQAPPWIKKADMPTARSFHSAAVVNGKVYVMGGMTRTESSTNLLQDVAIYDPATDSWSAGAPMPHARYGHTATVMGSKIYVVGGRMTGGGADDSVWEYDPGSNGWTIRNTAPVTVVDHSAVGTLDYVWLFPGPTTDVYAYEAVPDQWWSGNSSPARYEGHSASIVGSMVYLIGGSFRDWSPWVGNFTNYTTACMRFDLNEPYGSTNAWTYMTGMGTDRAGLATAVVDGKIFAIGGGNSDGPQRAVEMYDPATDTWTQRFPLMTGTRDHTAVAVNGKIYVMGGGGYWDSVAAVYEYDPANEW